jgi:hypothetical protein
MKMTRNTWIVIVIVVVVIVLIWSFWPSAKHETHNTAVEAPPPAASVAASAPSLPPTQMGSLGLNADQAKKLAPILQHEDEQIAKIVDDKEMTHDAKAKAIRKVRQADEKAVKKILTPDQFKTLAMQEKTQDIEAISNP